MPNSESLLLRRLTLLSSLLPFLAPSFGVAETVGYWRVEKPEEAPDDIIDTVVSEVNSPALDAFSFGSAFYGTDIPNAVIYDPVTDTSVDNTTSLECPTGFSGIEVDDDFTTPVLNSENFTLEFFFKLVGEPENFNSFIRRTDSTFNQGNPASLRRWQVDFSHGANTGFGRMRSRFDTIDSTEDPPLQTDTNIVANGFYVFADTESGDGLPGSYTFEAPFEDPFDEGDGVNDIERWNHIALVFQNGNGVDIADTFSLYVNYQLEGNGSRELAGDFVHPDGSIQIGKLFGGDIPVFLDEIRMSDTALAPDQFLRAGGPGSNPFDPSVAGYWRFDQSGAAEGNGFLTIENATGDPLLEAQTAGSPSFTADVPGLAISDPMSGAVLPNTIAMTSTEVGTIRVDGGLSSLNNPSFTIEMFIKLIGEPTSFHAFLRRRVGNGDEQVGFQIDFDHGNFFGENPGTNFGNIRARWDSIPIDDGMGGILDDTNRVTGGGRIYVDTDSGSGDPIDYVNDPDTPDDNDPSLQGDGINDDASTTWHHVAVTFEEIVDIDGTFRFATLYTDYEETGFQELVGGWSLPQSQLIMGHIDGATYEVRFDEIRYTNAVLTPDQFLRALPNLPSSIEISNIEYRIDAGITEEVSVFLEWTSEAGRTYRVEGSNDLETDGWTAIANGISGADGTTSFEENLGLTPPARRFYRVAEE